MRARKLLLTEPTNEMTRSNSGIRTASAPVTKTYNQTRRVNEYNSEAFTSTKYGQMATVHIEYTYSIIQALLSHVKLVVEP